MTLSTEDTNPETKRPRAASKRSAIVGSASVSTWLSMIRALLRFSICSSALSTWATRSGVAGALRHSAALAAGLVLATAVLASGQDKAKAPPKAAPWPPVPAGAKFSMVML